LENGDGLVGDVIEPADAKYLSLTLYIWNAPIDLTSAASKVQVSGA